MENNTESTKAAQSQGLTPRKLQQLYLSIRFKGSVEQWELFKSIDATYSPDEAYRIHCYLKQAAKEDLATLACIDHEVRRDRYKELMNTADLMLEADKRIQERLRQEVDKLADSMW